MVALEQLLQTPNLETDPLPDRQLIVCSAGRGGVIADSIRACAPHRYSEMCLIDPQLPIPVAYLKGIFLDNPTDRLLKSQIVKWLHRTTEGRPLVSQEDYLYGSRGIDQFNHDLTRIAALKLRALYPQLLESHRDGSKFVTCDVVTRDTGQLLKVQRSDLYIYQSHPGSQTEAQRAQFRDVFDAQYALIGTSFIVVSGRFPTATQLDLFKCMEILHGLAYDLSFDHNHLPPGMDIKVNQRFFLAAFRITFEIEEFAEIWPYLILANIPGGVDWSDYRMQECVEFWQFRSGGAFLEYPSPIDLTRYITHIGARSQGQWERFVYPSTESARNFGKYDFTAIRQGMPPAARLKSLLETL